MATDYPYTLSNNRIPEIIDKIGSAEKPPKFTYQYLKTLGYASSNDRAIVPLLKRLGFLGDDGTPTEYYDQLKDKTVRQYVLGERIRDAYSELYAINTSMHDQNEDEIKGAISRVTGKDDKSVQRYYNTFKKLASLATFDKKPESSTPPRKPDPEPSKSPKVPIPVDSIGQNAGFHYNIQLHLPATNDISVYNAIFKSLKDNLGM